MTEQSSLLDLWSGLAEYRSILDGVRKGYSSQLLAGMPPGQAAFLVAALARDTGRRLCCLAPDDAQAMAWAAELAAWLGEEQVRVFPDRELVPYRVLAHSPELASQRLAVLTDLCLNRGGAVVVPAPALLRVLAPPALYRGAILRLVPGQRLPLQDFVAHLARLGYERQERVEGPGQYSVRGGLCDCFPPGSNEPLRLEWFGDELESIRAFDPDSQRSLRPLQCAEVAPARELILPPDGLAAARRRLEEALRAELSRGGLRRAAARHLQELVEADLEALAEDPLGSPYELYAAALYERAASLLDYLPADTLLACWEPVRVQEVLRSRSESWERQVAGLVQEGQALPLQRDAAWPERAIVGALAALPALHFSLIGQQAWAEPEHAVELHGREIPAFHGQWRLFGDAVRRWRAQGYRILLVTRRLEEGRALQDTLRDEGFDPSPPTRAWQLPLPGRLAIGVGPPVSSYEVPSLRLALLDVACLTGGGQPRARVRTLPRASAGEERVRVGHFTDLSVGDYVVHVQHGIGRYLGIQTLEVQGNRRDYLLIQYEGADRLYVPTDQIELVQKYIGGEGRVPRLSRLGGAEWSRAKERARQSVRQMAGELLELYAARNALEGFAYPPDTPWQREFETAFPYEETVDQRRATEEIKRDMERPRPMDRLLCGDVGFGKTEVAMRAAFKAVMAGRQVAVLVPTTVLAQQHYLTFRERFGGFPVRVDVLSRFRSPQEQERVITDVRRGAVDIVIGTHRLLQDDVDFKSLGLLIIDEEQRFGVAHKERLKRLRQTVDVLTLTATPIPRTLHMGLAGLRDVSLIETPPQDRYPVETYVVEYDDSLVRDAIRRELARGGQVYYVHNRVQDIERVHRRLRELVPEARLGVAHGQMPDHALERAMMAFFEGERDVLLCTTIVENGLDIPNVNTLIVENADQFGLAQLYQIRGRVGRSNRPAYALLTYRPNRVLSEPAAKRLQAVREFTELGSGFKIALRDLELRGAGNLLGAEQSGFIFSIGFDLYTQLLEEAVRELRGERAVPATQPALELPADAFIPSSYVPDSRQKIELYKKIRAVQSLAEAAAVEEELHDRFGPPPEAVRNLLHLARIRVRATGLGVLVVRAAGRQVQIVFAEYLRDLLREVREFEPPYRGRVTPEWGRAALRWQSEGNGASLLEDVERFLASFAEHPALRRWLAAADPVRTV